MSTTAKPDYMQDLRALIATRPVNFIGAAALIQNEGGEVLLLRRAASERWGLCTGICELGEPLQDTLRREVHEEVGLEVKSARLLTMLSPAALSTVANGDQFYSYTAVFLVTDWAGVPTPDGHEIAEARFFAAPHWPALTRLGEVARAWVTDPAAW